ncbi:hypothetical protein Kpol_312p4 [Vanderwaltozyma polyspora DSM 70294]|uniref:t-SNARE coiled-coil homology domain-containing protein n=1 Tax=Vanderwaltozyma polyspora (strain ATCC 22028 / DSM 70294 / BCRC 21397 / CBS 2163 / NBRC 10782 / NRRL Y-8283 / UCD 57-17) TaxID=436907 RepID=A7TSI8_VANPO|nr:uncharacterized protein Kpol_312p4 [Vanderwaltozyma polyspora DSM 70294]EDO14766.1 hypothetical protein Kpol_312p4 [Vanderwaltozyma polyspora DSM 70294]
MNNRYNNSNLHQRDSNRSQLFGPDVDSSDGLKSPYETTKLDYSQSTLAQLESQSEENMGVMGEKIKALKALSMKMGDEIRGSNKNLDNLEDTFGNASAKLKNTFDSMMVMAKNSRISIKTWLIIFFIVILLFFWVWIT